MRFASRLLSAFLLRHVVPLAADLGSSADVLAWGCLPQPKGQENEATTNPEEIGAGGVITCRDGRRTMEGRARNNASEILFAAQQLGMDFT